MSQIVDNYSANVLEAGTKKRKKIRPTKNDVVNVLEAAFAQFPRLGTYTARAGHREVVLKGWPNSDKGQVLFHNELMQCCGLSLAELSKTRAQYYDLHPLPAARAAAAASAGERAGASAEPPRLGLDEGEALNANHGPPTPPGGLFGGP